MQSFCPAKIKLGFQIPLAWAIAQGLTPYQAAMPSSV
jgi:hypothetical protein